MKININCNNDFYACCFTPSVKHYFTNVMIFDDYAEEVCFLQHDSCKKNISNYWGQGSYMYWADHEFE